MGSWPGHKLSGSFRNLSMGECIPLARPVAPGNGAVWRGNLFHQLRWGTLPSSLGRIPNGGATQTGRG